MAMITSNELFGDYPSEVLDRFKEYHKNNPGIYEEFKALAESMRTSGRTKYSAAHIMSVLRWNYDVKSNDKNKVFKINNDFIPIYARLLIYNDNSYNSFFELRQVRSLGIQSDEEKKRRGI